MNFQKSPLLKEGAVRTCNERERSSRAVHANRYGRVIVKSDVTRGGNAITRHAD